ncbi:MAG: hypothetical protein ACJ795_09820 [Ktedonobacteraceae bacterium]
MRWYCAKCLWHAARERDFLITTGIKRNRWLRVAELTHISARWEIEIFFEDGKEELGLDHYQVMSASALLRFWTLAMLAYVFLEEEQQRLRVLWQRPVSIGEARREIQRRHRRCLLEWLHHQFLSGVHPESLFELFAA